MIVLVVALAPLMLGFVLIALIARYSPNVPRHAATVPGQADDDRPTITADEFEDIIKELLGALGLEIVFSSAGTGGVLELTCRDPRPLSGGRLLVHASPVVGAGQVDAAEVLGEYLQEDGHEVKVVNDPIAALEALKRPATVELHTDSKYVHDGISKWIHGWKRNGWKTADKKPVKNAELWRELDALRLLHEVKWYWVKGHADNAGNIRADELANRGAATVASV